MVSPFVLTVLKYVFLALLYFFVIRALRAAVVELRRNGNGRDRAAKKSQPKGAPKAPRPPKTGKAKAPVIAIVRNAAGKKIGSKKLTGTLQIGRDDACDIRPDDPYLSQFHAKLYANDGVWYVEDLGSTNGTYLNQQRLTGAVEVHAGDTIRVGEVTMELRR